MKVKTVGILLGAAAAVLCFQSCRAHVQELSGATLQSSTTSTLLGEGESLIVILATNDIHGGIDPSFVEGKPMGGLLIWNAIVSSVKEGLGKRYGTKAGIFLVDGGDQFQGSVVSNFDEGATMFSLLSKIGYDAAVPGNHDYDFGPRDNIQQLDFRDVDPVEEVKADDDDGSNPAAPISPETLQARRGALLHALTKANFPLLSANTFEMSSLKSSHGDEVRVDSVKCKPAAGSGAINWAEAKHPAFLKPYLIKVMDGVPIVLIGIDNDTTPTTTIDINVRDLCFREGAPAYLQAVSEAKASIKERFPTLAMQRPIFLMLIHDSDLGEAEGVSKMVGEILAKEPDSLHAVVAGHTHRVEYKKVKGVPIIQSGSGGGLFGRIDLVWNKTTGKADAARSVAVAGIKMHSAKCDSNAAAFCTVTEGSVKYEGVPLNFGNSSDSTAELAKTIEAARQSLPFDIRKKVGTAPAEVTKDFNKDSPMARFVTDMMVGIAAADIAFINTGSIRATFPKGEVVYEDLYKMLPFATRLVVLKEVDTKTVVNTLKIAVRGGHPYGALMQSGLKIKLGKKNGATFLKSLALASGESLYTSDGSIETVLSDRKFKIATTDFLMRRKSGPEVLRDIRGKEDQGVLREVIASKLFAAPAIFPVEVDDRWAL